MRLIAWLVLCLPGWYGLVAQNLVQSNFSGTFVPRFMASGTSTRLPVIFRARLSGLSASTSFRYYTMASVSSDFGNATSGAGNPLLMSDTGFLYTSSPSMTSNYDTFTTNSSGEYTGWFGFVNTGNARFTAGNTIYPSITLGTGTTVSSRYALDSGIRVLAFSTAAGANNGTGIYGTSYADPKDIAGLFDNMAGTGRPLTVVYVESENISIPSTVGYYSSFVDGVQGAWGGIIPNSLPSGVQRFSLYSFRSGAWMYSDTDANGVWPTGISTVNPSGGSSTPIYMPSSVVALPVTQFPLESQHSASGTMLHWVLAGKGSGRIRIEISDGLNDFSTVRGFNWFSDEKGRGSCPLPQGIRTGSATGKYYLRLSFLSRDEYVSNVVELPIPPAGISWIRLLGNPVGDRLQAILPPATRSVHLEVLNLQGKRCLEISATGEWLDIKLDLPPGVYFLRYSNETPVPFLKD